MCVSAMRVAVVQVIETDNPERLGKTLGNLRTHYEKYTPLIENFFLV
jgi:hypothetical protein